jgi:hypothetical protein
MSAMRCLIGVLIIGLSIAAPCSAQEGPSASSESVDSSGSGVGGYDIDKQTDYNEYRRANEEWKETVAEHNYELMVTRFVYGFIFIAALAALRPLFAFAHAVTASVDSLRRPADATKVEEVDRP